MIKLKFSLNNTPQEIKTNGKDLIKILKDVKWACGYDIQYMGGIAILRTNSSLERLNKQLKKLEGIENITKIELFQ
jgi:hypothetical protein